MPIIMLTENLFGTIFFDGLLIFFFFFFVFTFHLRVSERLKAYLFLTIEGG